MFVAWFEPFDEIMFLTLLSPWLRVFYGLSVSRKQGRKHWSFLPNQRVQYCSLPTGGSMEPHQLLFSLSSFLVLLFITARKTSLFFLSSHLLSYLVATNRHILRRICFLASALVYPLAFKLPSLRLILPLFLWHEEFPVVHRSSRLPSFFSVTSSNFSSSLLALHPLETTEESVFLGFSPLLSPLALFSHFLSSFFFINLFLLSPSVFLALFSFFKELPSSFLELFLLLLSTSFSSLLFCPFILSCSFWKLQRRTLSWVRPLLYTLLLQTSSPLLFYWFIKNHRGSSVSFLLSRYPHSCSVLLLCLPSLRFYQYEEFPLCYLFFLSPHLISPRFLFSSIVCCRGSCSAFVPTLLSLSLSHLFC